MLHILAVPDELRVQVRMPTLEGHLNRFPLLPGERRLILAGGNVLARRVLVPQRCHRFPGRLAFRHGSLQEGVHNSQTFDPLTMLKVFAIEFGAARFEGRGNDQRVT